LAAGALPGFYIEQIAVVERGCWPLPLPDYYAWDAEHLKEYVRLAATDEARDIRSNVWRASGIKYVCHERSRRPGLTNIFRDEELLAAVVADLIGDVRHVAVGNASPIPATAALLARARRGNGGPYVSLLGSPRHTFFTDGGRELFDCAGRAASTCSSSPAARSTAKATSTWSASATTNRPRASPARSARRICISWCRR
jgi:hypothetical protein